MALSPIDSNEKGVPVMRMRLMLLMITICATTTFVLAQDKAASTATVYGFKATAETTAALDLKGIGTVVSSAGEVELSKAEVQALLKGLGDLPSTLRFDGSAAGDIVRIFCIYRDDGTKGAEVKVDEKKRQPLIADQFKTLIKIAQAVAAGPSRADIFHVEQFDYKLKYLRATLKITAQIKDTPENAGLATAAGGPKWYVVFDFTNSLEPKNADSTTATILTGPREAWSLSADVPITSIGDVKVDDAGENLNLKDTPDVFYAGLNFAPRGDALRPPDGPLEAITIKGLLKVSRRPSDSFGIGIGLRPGVFANSEALGGYSFLKILDMVSPFVAYTRTRGEEDRPNGDGTTTKVRFKRNDFIVGISLDLEKALGFLNGGGDGGDEEEDENEN